MNSKLTNLFLGSILFSISAGSTASSLLGPDLVGYSPLAGAALDISAGSIVTDDRVALAAIGIDARTDTANIYPATGAVTGATSDVTCGNLFTNTTAAIGIGTMISTHCLATDTWTDL